MFKLWFETLEMMAMMNGLVQKSADHAFSKNVENHNLSQTP